MNSSIRSPILFAVAIATIYPIVRASSVLEFAIWIAIGCVVWGAAGLSLRSTGSKRKTFALLGLAPLLVAVADNAQVPIYDGWPEVTILPSLPAGMDASNATLHYVALPRRDMLPFVLEHGTETDEAIAVSNLDQPLKLKCHYSCRGSQFGNTWGHVCEYDIIVFLATAPNGTFRHGVVEIPDVYDPSPFTIRWEDTTHRKNGDRATGTAQSNE